MIAKSERFEMRLDTELINRVDLWRSRQDDVPSRAEAIRRLVETSLSGEPDEDLKLNKPERLMVWMLSEILRSNADYKDQEKVALIQEAIYGGHFWALDWEMHGVLHCHSDRKSAVSLVVDTLDMWGFIERAYAGFSPEEKTQIETEVKFVGRDPKFSGFDGNHESEHMAIARFLIEKLGRFEDFRGRSFNSHMPKISQYRAMLQAFEPIRAKLVGRGLSVEEVITILHRQ
jgi:uncharacterized protein